MKEIKAYVRPDHLDQVVTSLDKAGAPGITVVEVHPVGYGFEPNYFSEARETIKTFPRIVKIEIICQDYQVEGLITTILDTVSTGSKGDGMIFISPIEEAIRVRDGLRGDGIL
jgi:nitrogen regulatory protein PII